MRRACAVALVGLVSFVMAGHAPAAEPGARDVPALLPSDTVAYLKLGNMTAVYDAMQRSGFRDAFLQMAQREGREEGQAAAAVDNIFRNLLSVHLSFHGWTRYRREYVKLLLVADVARTRDLKTWLPLPMAGMLRPASKCGG